MGNERWQLGLVLTLSGFFSFAPSSLAQGGGLPGPHHYQLFEGSKLLDECTVCGQVTLDQPVRGSFTLELLEENPLFATYAVRDLSFSTGLGSNPFQSGPRVLPQRASGRKRWQCRLLEDKRKPTSANAVRIRSTSISAE